MTDKTVTVTLPLGVARRLAAQTDDVDDDRAFRTALEAALPPEWEEGMIAWVTDDEGDRYLAHLERGEWVPCTGTLVAVLSSEDDLLPSVLRCDTDPDHAYSAADWRRLGERIHSAVREAS